MKAALGPDATEAGYKAVALKTVDSTNSEAMRRWTAGERGPLWIVAHRQTQGRGRRGRAWQTIEGNLAASLLIGVDAPPEQLATLGFAAGLAVVDAILAVARGETAGTRVGNPKLALKWPNDVTIDGAKVAGIMLESENRSPREAALVVGIGVNVAGAPTGLPYPAACLRDYDPDVTAESVFASLADAWVTRYARWTADGFAVLREDWLRYAQGIGGSVSVTSGTFEARGIFETLDQQGHLILRAADGRAIPIAAGDVHFGSAATMPATG